MNKKWIKIGAITLVSLGALYGGYKLVKYIVEKRKESNLEPLPVDIVDTSNKQEIKQVSKPSFDGKKIVTKGSKGDEAKTIQTALNNIINDAKRLSSTDATKETRRKEIASLTPLKVDGIFGAKSVGVLIKIMGKSSASYNEVRDKRLAFSKVYGGGNPYSK